MIVLHTRVFLQKWREGERVENRGRDEFGKANPKDKEELRSGEAPLVEIVRAGVR